MFQQCRLAHPRDRRSAPALVEPPAPLVVRRLAHGRPGAAGRRERPVDARGADCRARLRRLALHRALWNRFFDHEPMAAQRTGSPRQGLARPHRLRRRRNGHQDAAPSLRRVAGDLRHDRQLDSCPAVRRAVEFRRRAVSRPPVSQNARRLDLFSRRVPGGDSLDRLRHVGAIRARSLPAALRRARARTSPVVDSRRQCVALRADLRSRRTSRRRPTAANGARHVLRRAGAGDHDLADHHRHQPRRAQERSPRPGRRRPGASAPPGGKAPTRCSLTAGLPCSAR